MGAGNRNGLRNDGWIVGTGSITHTGTTKVYVGVAPVDGRITSVGALVTTGVTVAADTVTITNETQSTTATYTQAIKAVNLGAQYSPSVELDVAAGDVISLTPGGLSTAGVTSVNVYCAAED